MRLLRFVPLLLLATRVGAEVQADGAIDARIGLSRAWDVLVHNRARVKAAQNDWYDVSSVPIFRYQATRDVQFSAGAFLSRTEYKGGWKNVFRPTVSLERTWRGEHFALGARTGYERFFIFRGLDYNRYRERLRFSRNGRWSPYAGTEAFFTDHGWATTRWGCGVKRNLGRRDAIEFGYWYETKRFMGPGIRHMFVTTFSINFQGFAPQL
ncbi:MAG: DUF2490 domain-containing protein [Bryobacteraceae bacterium]|nr:DUF2490 domain-containing protein [Bryobacteraceae bacterium]